MFFLVKGQEPFPLIGLMLKIVLCKSYFFSFISKLTPIKRTEHIFAEHFESMWNFLLYCHTAGSKEFSWKEGKNLPRITDLITRWNVAKIHKILSSVFWRFNPAGVEEKHSKSRIKTLILESDFFVVKIHCFSHAGSNHLPPPFPAGRTHIDFCHSQKKIIALRTKTKTS